MGPPPQVSPVRSQKDSLTYSSYLKVPELTALQSPLSFPVAHDEMLFIIIHQTYELWFKQVLFELDSLVDFIEKDELLPAFRLLDRVYEIFRVLIQQVDILETMTPVEFNRFRSNLNPASGFQSRQFRELELLCGAPISDYEGLEKVEPEWLDIIDKRSTRPTLRSAFLNILTRRGLALSAQPEQVKKAIVKVYQSTVEPAVHNLCEDLIQFDEQVSLWRFRHVQMVERMIGMKMGTGGSLGVPYLKGTLKKRFFPELWDARTELA